MRLNLTRSLACIALATVATPAFAEEVSISVPYSDLDLSSDEMVGVLKSRLADAATTACTADRWEISANAVADCRATLVRKGLAEVKAKLAAQP